jgi:2-polyprenyl-6-methoxyphenol hydroxylase-like FAD-dependent oxidoreductase
MRFRKRAVGKASMVRPRAEHVVIIGAGAVGLMAAREFARAGRRVTVQGRRRSLASRRKPYSIILRA